MRTFILMISAASLAMPLASAVQAQPGAMRHDRSTVGYTLRSVRMRAGPDSDYPTVRTIPSNRRVDVYGCLKDWSWCDVGYRNDRGWVVGDYLGADYRGRRQTIVKIGPSLSLGILTFIFGSYWDDHYRSRPFYSQRPSWERHYYDNYRPQWGPRPAAPPAMQRPDGREGDREGPRGVRPDVRPGARPNVPPNMQQRPGVPPQAGPDTVRPNAAPGQMNDRTNQPPGRNPRAAAPQAQPSQQAGRPGSKDKGDKGNEEKRRR